MLEEIKITQTNREQTMAVARQVVKFLVAGLLTVSIIAVLYMAS